jgi:peptidoglycan lytic transglycosylase
MRRVAGVLPLNPGSLAALIVVAIAGPACLLAVLNAVDSPLSQQTPSRAAKISPEPSQSVNREKKAARETTGQPHETGALIEARLTPGVLPPIAPNTGVEDGAPPETGRASWYALQSVTASGEPMDEDALTAAHRSLRLRTFALVENLDNGRAVLVRINDRGPFAKDRIIDLSKAAAEGLDMIEDGVANVRVSPVSDAVASNIKASGQAAPLDR